MSYSKSFSHSQRSVIRGYTSHIGIVRISELRLIIKNLTLMSWNKTHKKICSRYAFLQNVTTYMRDKCPFNVKFRCALPNLFTNDLKSYTSVRCIKMRPPTLQRNIRHYTLSVTQRSATSANIYRKNKDEVHFTGHHDKALDLRLPVLRTMQLDQRQQGKSRLSGELQGQCLYQPRKDMIIRAFV